MIQQLEAHSTVIRVIRDEPSARRGCLALVSRVGRADHVFVVLSQKYLTSPFCMTELFFALDRERRGERVRDESSLDDLAGMGLELFDPSGVVPDARHNSSVTQAIWDDWYASWQKEWEIWQASHTKSRRSVHDRDTLNDHLLSTLAKWNEAWGPVGDALGLDYPRYRGVDWERQLQETDSTLVSAVLNRIGSVEALGDLCDRSYAVYLAESRDLNREPARAAISTGIRLLFQILQFQSDQVEVPAERPAPLRADQLHDLLTGGKDTQRLPGTAAEIFQLAQGAAGRLAVPEPNRSLEAFAEDLLQQIHSSSR